MRRPPGAGLRSRAIRGSDAVLPIDHLHAQLTELINDERRKIYETAAGYRRLESSVLGERESWPVRPANLRQMRACQLSAKPHVFEMPLH